LWQNNGNPLSPINLYSYYVGYNPPTSYNPIPKHPKIHYQAFLSPFIFIVGDVTIQRNTYVAPFVSIRADEGTPFYIGENCNLQDGVTLHGLKGKSVEKNKNKYSIYIANRVSCAHGALIHGPVLIEEDVFISFNAIVYNASIGKGSFVSAGAVVTNGIKVAPHRFVPTGSIIDTQEEADQLKPVPKSDKEFAEAVQSVNQEFPKGYSLYFGKSRCSCGVAC